MQRKKAEKLLREYIQSKHCILFGQQLEVTKEEGMIGMVAWLLGVIEASGIQVFDKPKGRVNGNVSRPKKAIR